MVCILTDRSYKDQLTIIERIKTCNNPNVTPQNKPKMEVRDKRRQLTVLPVEHGDVCNVPKNESEERVHNEESSLIIVQTVKLILGITAPMV